MEERTGSTASRFRLVGLRHRLVKTMGPALLIGDGVAHALAIGGQNLLGLGR